jgi:hypothetical protein
MKLKPNIAISESGFIFNPSTGDSFTTNEIGLEILRLLRDESDKENIVSHLHQHFAADEQSIDRDLVDFIMMLESYQLLKSDA